MEGGNTHGTYLPLARSLPPPSAATCGSLFVLSRSIAQVVAASEPFALETCRVSQSLKLGVARAYVYIYVLVGAHLKELESGLVSFMNYIIRRCVTLYLSYRPRRAAHMCLGR